MLKRTITALIATAVLVPVLIFSKTVVLPIAIALCIIIALFEIFRCIGIHKNYALTVPFYLFGAASPFAVRYLERGSIPDLRDAALVTMAVILIYVLAVVVISLGKTTFSDAASAFAAALYICFSFCGIVFLRDNNAGVENLYLYIFIAAWVTDIFAYFTGYLFGKHKLIPEISPKKTIEGSVGGIVFCTAAFVLAWYLFDSMRYLALWEIIIAGIVTSCISQIGDLAMSAIKRQHNIKDYGKIFPGHGGILDRFDSILAVSLTMTVISIIAEALH